MITLENINGFSPNLAYALILLRPSLGLLMAKCRQFLTELSARDTSVFSLLADNFGNINGFSPNLVCALILWRSALGLLMGKFHLFLKELFARSTSVFYFQDNNLSKSQWIFTKFDMCIYILWRAALGLLIGKFRQFLTRVICPRHDYGGVLSFHVLFTKS